MVPDTPDVEAVLFGAGGVAEGLGAGQGRRRHELDLADRDQGIRSEDQGARRDYLDAPVSGGEVGAKAASLTIMVGGSQEAFDAVKPIFEKMGKNITLVGGNGDGQTTKVANQIIVALNIEAVAEALALRLQGGRRSGARAPGADGRLRRLAHPRSARRAHGQAHLRSGLPHRAAPEGPQSRAAGRARRSASRCPTPPRRRNCSTPAPPMAARPGTIRRWCGRSRLMADHEGRRRRRG